LDIKFKGFMRLISNKTRENKMSKEAQSVNLSIPNNHNGRFGITFTAILILMCAGVLAACQGNNINLTDFQSDKTPKLSSQISALIRAESSGQADSYAQENNIELINHDVRVIVEAIPEQVDTAAEAAARLGKVETSYENLLQVIIPISGLEDVANEASVRSIRLPMQAEPYASENTTE
jgi:hypothetical protein